MKQPVFGVLSLAVPVIAIMGGYLLMKNAKSPTNLGEAIGPMLGWGILVLVVGIFGEISAILSLVRGERLAWLPWAGMIGNGVLLLGLVYFVANLNAK